MLCVHIHKTQAARAAKLLRFCVQIACAQLRGALLRELLHVLRATLHGGHFAAQLRAAQVQCVCVCVCVVMLHFLLRMFAVATLCAVALCATTYMYAVCVLVN